MSNDTQWARIEATEGRRVALLSEGEAGFAGLAGDHAADRSASSGLTRVASRSGVVALDFAPWGHREVEGMIATRR